MLYDQKQEIYYVSIENKEFAKLVFSDADISTVQMRCETIEFKDGTSLQFLNQDLLPNRDWLPFQCESIGECEREVEKQKWQLYILDEKLRLRDANLVKPANVL